MLKKIAAAAGLTFTLAACGNSPEQDLSGQNLSVGDVTAKYSIDSFTNAVEFTPAADANKTCVAVVYRSGSGQSVYCFDKPQPVQP